MRAGAGDQDSAGGEQPESSEINVLVATERAVELLAGFGERGRIENHRVEVAARRRVAGKNVEGVVFAQLEVRY